MSLNGHDKRFRVRAAHCDHLADDAEVERILRQVTEPLDRAWAQLEAAKRIVIKANWVYWPDHIRRTDGRRQELVDDAVMRGVLRLLRERTTARIQIADTSLAMDGDRSGPDVDQVRPIMEEFGAEYIECNRPPFAEYPVPGGGLMFRRYLLHECFRQADAVVDVATLKSHAFMGVTLCTKNLFGVCPIHPLNRPRQYFHHIIRMPYFLPDLARIIQPCLNIVDGLVAQSGREWGGEARIGDMLMAGDHVIATDVCGATLMGADPYSEWPTPPFRRDQNHLKMATDSGFGPKRLDEVDFHHDLQPPVALFDSDVTDPPEQVGSWRRSMCEQALEYRDNRERYEREYAGDYILLQDGVVLWHGSWQKGYRSRRDLSGAKKGRAIWFKYVDPDEWEDERFDVYERELARLDALAPALA